MPDTDVGEVIDRRALSAYRRRLTELEEDLSEAESRADQARAAKLRSERDALLDQVMAATGLHGRQRRTGSAGERARVAVRKAVAAAIDRIEQMDPRARRVAA
jgi:ATPase subunit of ABC transporter with duplicated ATPase domains